jgi:hypothetical protein
MNQANHPQIAVDRSGSLIVAWDESGDGSRRVVIARGAPTADGDVVFDRREWPGARPASYPVLSTTGDGVLLAWSGGEPSNSVIRVEPIQERGASR